MTTCEVADTARLEQRVLDNYVDLFDAFFAERAAIPAGRLCEVAFADLEARPLEVLRQVYETLSLGGFEQLEPHAEAYLASLGDFRKNRFTELPEPLRKTIASRWQRCFEAFGYPV